MTSMSRARDRARGHWPEHAPKKAHGAHRAAKITGRVRQLPPTSRMSCGRQPRRGRLMKCPAGTAYGYAGVGNARPLLVGVSGGYENGENHNLHQRVRHAISAAGKTSLRRGMSQDGRTVFFTASEPGTACLSGSGTRQQKRVPADDGVCALWTANCLLPRIPSRSLTRRRASVAPEKQPRKWRAGKRRGNRRTLNSSEPPRMGRRRSSSPRSS